MTSQLDSIAALPDQKSKLDQYRQALSAITGSVAELQAFVDHSELLPCMHACFQYLSPHADQGMDVRFATLAISLYGIRGRGTLCIDTSVALPCSAVGHSAAGSKPAAAVGFRPGYQSAAG